MAKLSDMKYTVQKGWTYGTSSTGHVAHDRQVVTTVSS